jgi:hypothetical protein
MTRPRSNDDDTTSTGRRRPPSAGGRRRTLARARRHRARRKAGRATYQVEVDAAVLDLLVRLHWIEDRDVTDAAAVSRAIAALLADAAR